MNKEPRTVVTLRISTAGLAAIDKVAARDHRSRSDAMRLMLAYASTHMPKGWTP